MRGEDRGDGGDRVAVPVGAHVVEVSGELHLFGLLSQRLPDSCRLVRTAGHGHVGAVVELVPRSTDERNKDVETCGDKLNCRRQEFCRDRTDNVLKNPYIKKSHL